MIYNSRLVGLLAFLLVCIMLAIARVADADEYYNCQFLGLCSDGKPNSYIPAVECGRKC